VNVALWLLAVQGVIGAFDTLYYHEWRARLPARGMLSAPELKLHAARNCLYAVLFGTLPWLAWQGRWTWLLVGVLVTEIVLTLTDFVVEVSVRKTLGDVYGGERITHAIMGILYGAMIASLIPVLVEWSACASPTISSGGFRSPSTCATRGQPSQGTGGQGAADKGEARVTGGS